MKQTLTMNNTFNKLANRALGFYPEASVSEDHTLLKVITGGDELAISRTDLDGHPAIMVRAEKDGIARTRVLVEDPSVFDNVKRGDKTFFVKTTKSLNGLVRDHNPEAVAAYEASAKADRQKALIQKEAMKVKRAQAAQEKRDAKALNKANHEAMVKEAQAKRAQRREARLGAI